MGEEKDPENHFQTGSSKQHKEEREISSIPDLINWNDHVDGGWLEIWCRWSP